MRFRLENAKLYEKQIREKMWKCWYDEKYQYYFGTDYRSDFSLADNTNSYPLRAFAVLNKDGEVIGLVKYYFDPDLRIAERFGAINFSDDVITFGLALKQVIVDCFVKYGANIVEWAVIIGNPIEEGYDKMCAKLGGHIIGVRRGRNRKLNGEICSDKLYEVSRRDFFSHYKKGTKEHVYPEVFEL